MSTFAVTNTDDLLSAVNYAISNLGQNNAVTADTDTGVISAPLDPVPIGYLYQYINVRYADSTDGTSNFSTSPTNRLYYGLRNSTASAASSNPTDYIWYAVTGGFGTTKFLFYNSIGGRQINWFAGTTAPGADYIQTTDGVAIDLDVVTTATGTDGSSIAVLNVYLRSATAPSTPTGGTYDFDTLTLTPPSGWSADPPAGSNPLYISQNTFESNTGGTVAPSLAWSTPAILVENGAEGAPGISIYSYPVFQQSGSLPSTPGADGSYDFGTQTGTPPSGWTNAPTSLTTDPIWITTAQASANTPTGIWNATVSSWSVPVQYTGEGGVDGQRGFIPMGYVLTTQDPTTSPGNTQANLTAAFSASRTSNTAPIGTGYSPVLGDTASFTYASNTAVNTVYTYTTGDVWQLADGQIINGNVFVTGSVNSTALNTNDLYSINIQSTNANIGNLSSAGYWFQASTGNAVISGNLLVGNSVTIGNVITSGALAANSVGTTQITPGSITTEKFTANTINGNIISAGTITAEQLAANAIIANTVVSNGAILGSYASLGFWLDGSTGNARFGNTVSVGDKLTVGGFANIGASAIIGANVSIGNNANIGNSLIVRNSANIGNNLTVGANATIGANLIVGTNANIGASLRIGDSAIIGNTITIGNNASIGGNLTVSGLITGGNLSNSTVNTQQVITSAISSGISNARTSNTVIASNATLGTYYPLTGLGTIDVPYANTVAYIFWDASQYTTWSGSGTIYFNYRLYRSVGGGAFTTVVTQTTGPFNPFVTQNEPGFSYFDSALTTYGTGVTYRYYVGVSATAGNGTPTSVNISSNFNSIIVQSLKR